MPSLWTDSLYNKELSLMANLRELFDAPCIAGCHVEAALMVQITGCCKVGVLTAGVDMPCQAACRIS